jgi:hypothetical protein
LHDDVALQQLAQDTGVVVEALQAGLVVDLGLGDWAALRGPSISRIVARFAGNLE